MSFTREIRSKMKADAKPRKQRKTRTAKAARPARTPLRKHPLFAPLIGIWGAAAGGLSVMILPWAVIAPLCAMVLSGASPDIARIAVAVAGALALGLAFYAAGWLISKLTRVGYARAAQPSSRAAVQPIDPANELGSDTLDAPLADEAWLDHDDEDNSAWLPWQSHAPERDTAGAAASAPRERELSEREDSEGDDLWHDHIRHDEVWDNDIEHDDAGHDGAGHDDIGDDDIASPVTDRAPAHGLDLAAIADLPARDGAWAEPQPQTWQDQPNPAAKPVAAAPTAMERLRELPVSELSLCQMLERFAAALQDYQETSRSDGSAVGHDQREAMLADALKALEQMTGQGLDELAPQGGAQMRAAMWAQAQQAGDKRGAA